MASTAVLTNPQFISAVENVVDSLCFYSTHEIDADFRAHTKTAVDTIQSLQSEQRQRVQTQYGPSPSTPDLLASQLEELYRMDAQNVLSSLESKQPNVVDAMSLATAKIFKREMKVRIHEWEGSFKLLYGREAGAQDKAPLRGIYELYKVVKNKVQRNIEGDDRPVEPPPSEHRPAPRRPHDSVGVTSAAIGTSSSGASAPGRTPGPTGSTPETKLATPQPPATKHPVGAPSPVTIQRAHDPTGTSISRVPQTAAGHPTSSSSAPSAAPKGEHLDPSAQPDVAALTAEKKMLKRKLHQFEDEFRKQNGRQPTKDDRRLMGRDYHRYGELKALLAPHVSSGEGQ